MVAGMGKLLSIGLPVFNGERYLAEALAGLQAQTLTDVEVVIADNASTDHTDEVAREVAAADPRFRYVRREHNIGLVPNYNQVFADTDSEFFAWHASDDRAHPEFYQACVALLRRHPTAAAATSEILLMDPAGQVLGPDPEPIRADHPDPAVRFRELASFRHFAQFTYGVYRRSMMARTRLMLPFFWTSDRLFLAELALQGPLVRDPRRLFYVRQHGERVTLGGRANFYAGLASPQRGTTWRYARELRRAIDHAGLAPADRERVRQALRWWQVRHGPRLARSAAGALVSAALRQRPAGRHRRTGSPASVAGRSG
jgi:glycosyltransferase involved in cell wall biosynthesis